MASHAAYLQKPLRTLADAMADRGGFRISANAVEAEHQLEVTRLESQAFAAHDSRLVRQ